MGMDSLNDILCCPACHGELQFQELSGIRCKACLRSFPVVDGLPDLRFFDDSNSFDANQAKYEADLADEEAVTDYEERVILMWGQKTALMAREWAKEAYGRILDYGCGTGQISRILKHHHEPLFAFDISLNSVKKNINHNSVIGVVANAFHLPFREKSFDTVLINGVLHHIVNYEKALGEVSRIARDKVFISELCTRAYHINRATEGLTHTVALHFFVKMYARLRRKLQRSGSYIGGSKFERALDTEEVVQNLFKNGFEIDSCKFWTNLDYRTKRGIIKMPLTKLLVSDRCGTHFDIRAKKCS